MHGLQKMTMWRGKPIAGLKGADMESFRAEMMKMADRRAFAPAQPPKPEKPEYAKTNLRGK